MTETTTPNHFSFFPLLFILLNVLGVLGGALYYAMQFANTDLLFWLFVPDCPLYVLFGLLCYFNVIRSDTFRLITGIGLVKYGLWTLFAFAYYPQVFFSPPFFLQTVALTLGHLGMAAEGFLFLPKKADARVLVLAVAWFLVNDLVDWLAVLLQPFNDLAASLPFLFPFLFNPAKAGSVLFNLHPYLPTWGWLGFALFTIAETILFVLVLGGLATQIRSAGIVRKLREAFGFQED